MTEDRSGIQAIDSLSANEFKVEIDGEVMTGVFGVSGVHIRRVSLDAGKLVHQPLVISKMVQRDPDLPANRWTRETMADPTAKVTRTVAIVAMDEGEETRRWVYQDAWISDIAYSDFDTSSEALIEERLTIQHGGVYQMWPDD